MHEFIAKHENKIAGTLSGFDQLVFRWHAAVDCTRPGNEPAAEGRIAAAVRVKRGSTTIIFALRWRLASMGHLNPVSSLGPRFGRRAMTNGWIDIKNTDMMLIMGANPAENHGGCTDTNEFNYLAAKTSLGVCYRANQARV